MSTPPVDDPLGRELAKLEALMALARDHHEWPDGHPCRDCGRLYREHPVTASVLECMDWR